MRTPRSRQWAAAAWGSGSGGGGGVRLWCVLCSWAVAEIAAGLAPSHTDLMLPLPTLGNKRVPEVTSYCHPPSAAALVAAGTPMVAGAVPPLVVAGSWIPAVAAAAATMPVAAAAGTGQDCIQSLRTAFHSAGKTAAAAAAAQQLLSCRCSCPAQSSLPLRIDSG